MKLNWRQELQTLDGDTITAAYPKKDDNGVPVLDSEGKPEVEEKPWVLGEIAKRALMVEVQADQQMTPEEKFNLMQLAHAVHNNLELSRDEVQKIRQRIGKCIVRVVQFAAWREIDRQLAEADKPAEDACEPKSQGA